MLPDKPQLRSRAIPVPRVQRSAPARDVQRRRFNTYRYATPLGERAFVELRRRREGDDLQMPNRGSAPHTGERRPCGFRGAGFAVLERTARSVDRIGARRSGWFSTVAHCSFTSSNASRSGRSRTSPIPRPVRSTPLMRSASLRVSRTRIRSFRRPREHSAARCVRAHAGVAEHPATFSAAGPYGGNVLKPHIMWNSARRTRNS